MILQTEDVLGGLISTLILISSPILIKYAFDIIKNTVEYKKNHHE